MTPAAGIRWLGHASVQIEIGGVRILTDPALTPRLGHLRRHHRLDRRDVERPDLVLVSHAHLDHLHVPSLRWFGRDLPVVVPVGAGRLLRRHGFTDVREVRAGDTLAFGPATILAVPAIHSSRRGPHSRIVATPVGYVVRADGAAVYFAGDTDLFDAMAGLGPIDVALLPIWGWGSTLGPGHLDPPRAAEAVERLQPGLVVPVHWGTYSPIGLRLPAWLDHPVERFATELSEIGLAGHLRILRPGEALDTDGE